jgi:hypothetical protein
MRVTADNSARGSTASDADRQAMYAVAAKLHDFGFGIRLPKDKQSRHLVILNAKLACSEITVHDGGYVIWDYWPWSGAAADPADLAEVALSLLGPANTRARPVVADGPTLKSRVGQALRELGLHVTMAVYEDADALDVTAEVVITNPAAPFCGLVRVADDARITWQCEIGGPAAECALAVTDTIVPLLIHGAGNMRQV